METVIEAILKSNATPYDKTDAIAALCSDGVLSSRTLAEMLVNSKQPASNGFNNTLPFKPGYGLHDIRVAIGQARGGRKIEAIKTIRTAMGLGLKDAKEFIEAIE